MKKKSSLDFDDLVQNFNLKRFIKYLDKESKLDNELIMDITNKFDIITLDKLQALAKKKKLDIVLRSGVNGRSGFGYI